MARLRVPAAAQGGLVLLTKLSKEQMSSLKEALRRASPGLVLPQLVEQIASAVPYSDDDASKVIAVLASFYSLKLEKGLSFDKFFDELFGALKRTGNKDLQLSDEQASEFRKHLEELLSLDESLGVTTRARGRRHRSAQSRGPNPQSQNRVSGWSPYQRILCSPRHRRP